MVDDDFPAGYCELDANVKREALRLMLVCRFNEDATAHDSSEEAIELCRLLTNESLECLRPFDATECRLRLYHHEVNPLAESAIVQGRDTRRNPFVGGADAQDGADEAIAANKQGPSRALPLLAANTWLRIAGARTRVTRICSAAAAGTASTIRRLHPPLRRTESPSVSRASTFSEGRRPGGQGDRNERFFRASTRSFVATPRSRQR
jgi:hypothetical protein